MKRFSNARLVTLDVDCTVDIAHTAEECYAHVAVHGVDIEPGDVFQIQQAPTKVRFGEHFACTRRATVIRGNWLTRLCARLRGYAELSSLYEVSFSSKRLHADAPARTPNGARATGQPLPASSIAGARRQTAHTPALAPPRNPRRLA